MEILKHGNLEKTRDQLVFKCTNCKCLFRADRSEYQFQYVQRENLAWYEIKCPECGTWCSVPDEQAERQWGKK